MDSTLFTVFKTAVFAETANAIVVARTPETYNPTAIADYYNKILTPNELAWISNMTARDLDEASNITVFDGITAGKRDAWMLFLTYAPRDMRKARNRAVITDVWGASNAADNAANILLKGCTRKITRAEKIIGGGVLETAGSGAGLVSALDLQTWEGQLSASDVNEALTYG